MHMRSEITLPNRFQIWWLAIRPRTLPAAAAGVIAGSALALHDRNFHQLPALAALLVALLGLFVSRSISGRPARRRRRVAPGVFARRTDPGRA